MNCVDHLADALSLQISRRPIPLMRRLYGVLHRQTLHVSLFDIIGAETIPDNRTSSTSISFRKRTTISLFPLVTFYYRASHVEVSFLVFCEVLLACHVGRRRSSSVSKLNKKDFPYFHLIAKTQLKILSQKTSL